MMRLTERLLTGTVLTLSLSALAYGPVDAASPEKPVRQPGPNLVAQAMKFMMGRVAKVEGTSVLVVFENGESKTYTVSSEDLERWDLERGTYVILEEGELYAPVYVGTVVGQSGPIYTVRLDSGEVLNIGVGPRRAGALNLVGGDRVWVEDKRFIVTNYRNIEIEGYGVAEKRTEITPSAPVTLPEVRRETTTRTTTVEVSEPAPTPQPVRGRW